MTLAAGSDLAALAARGWTSQALVRGAMAAIDLDAMRHNVARCRDAAASAEVMAVVKADAYGHGLVRCGQAAREAGAAWLATALPEEALALRAAGDTGALLSWLIVPGAPWADYLRARLDLSVASVWALDELLEAVRGTGITARIHLKVDTGLSRHGATLDDWPSLLQAVARARAEGMVDVVGVWSHLAFADAPEHPMVARQVERFDAALAEADRAGLRPQVRHLANSAATLALPRAHYDLVRPGIALYGLSPGAEVGTADDLGLRPVMSLRGRLASVKRVRAGEGVSYGHEYTTARDTTLALVPIGYADGLPRAAVNAGPVLAAGRRRTIAGRVCMDQVVLDLGDDVAAPGDEVVVFGAQGPSADEWAEVCGTIGYEIVTRIGPRVPRVYREASP